MKLDPEVLKIIDAAVNKATQETAKASKHDDQGEHNYFRETEILLYNYQALKLKVAQDEEFLFDPEASLAPASNRSKDIVMFSTRNTGSHGFDIDKYTQGIRNDQGR